MQSEKPPLLSSVLVIHLGPWNFAFSTISKLMKFSKDRHFQNYQGHLQEVLLYRFSALWLRSKCSICSSQFELWDVFHRKTMRSNVFLEPGRVVGACITPSASWLCIALPQRSAHYRNKEKFYLISCSRASEKYRTPPPTQNTQHLIYVIMNCNTFRDLIRIYAKPDTYLCKEAA